MSLHMDVCLYAHELARTHTWVDVFLPVCARLHMPICSCAYPWLFSQERGSMCFIWYHYSPEMCAFDPKYFF